MRGELAWEPWSRFSKKPHFFDLVRATIPTEFDWEHSFCYLNIHEQREAKRFDGKQKRDFIFSRAFRRQVLAKYLALVPLEIDFSFHGHGKPRVASSNQPLEFSLTHTKNHILMVLASDFPVGIDLECTQRVVAYEKIAKRFFPPALYRSWRDQNAPKCAKVFYAHWTAWEARVKLVGTRLFNQKVLPEAALTEVAPWPHYIASIATDPAPPLEKLRCYEFSC